MNPQDKIAGLKIITEQHRFSFNERRKIEYRLYFATLTFFALIVVAVYRYGSLLPQEWFLLSTYFKFRLLLAFFFVAVIVIFFLSVIATSNNTNFAYSK